MWSFWRWCPSLEDLEVRIIAFWVHLETKLLESEAHSTFFFFEGGKKEGVAIRTSMSGWSSSCIDWLELSGSQSTVLLCLIRPDSLQSTVGRGKKKKENRAKILFVHLLLYCQVHFLIRRLKT